MKKFITLVAAVAITLTASAESQTASFGSADASGLSKDTAVPCAGFTVPADYFASGTSKVNVYDGDKGMKLRANKGAGQNELMLTVNEGYTITDMTMGMVVNDANGTFTLSGISIDGTAVADFTSVSLPNTTTASGEAVVNLTGIKATKDIVFTYDFEGYEGKNRQVFIAGTVTYEEGGAEVGGNVFEWQPVNLYPQASADIMVIDFMGNVNFNCYVEGVMITDVMPAWIDEDGNEIKAVSGVQDPWGFDSSAFSYSFDVAAFKANGDYILLFPEGMLVNAAGDKSAKMEIPYTLNDPDFAPAMFDDFEVLSVTPELSQPQAVWNDQVVTVNTNHNDAIGLTRLIITDMETGEAVVYSSNFTVNRELGDTSEISWEVVGSYKFYEGHIYKAEFTFYNGQDEVSPEGQPTQIVGKVTFDFTGRVEGFKYSSETLISVEPVPGAYVITEPSMAVFTYTFSGPVSVDEAYSPLGQNGQFDYPESYLSSNEDKTVWTLDLSESDFIKTLDSALPISIRATDLEGYQLKGNSGEEELSSFEYEWECEIGAPAIEILVPAKEAVIERLTEVVVKSVNGASMEYVGYPAATIQSRNRSVLGELFIDWDYTPTTPGEVRFTQWIPEGSWEAVPLDLDAEGVYSIVFPHGAFMFGEQFESKQSHSAGTSFEISNGIVTPPSDQATFEYVSVDPASGSTVSSLEQIIITFSDMAGLLDWTVNVYKEGVEEPVTIADLEYDALDYNAIDVKLREPISTDGTYTITFKEGVIGDDPYCMSEGATGTCNPEFKLVYTVGEGSGVGSVAAETAGNVYDVNGRIVLRNASAADINSLDKGIYIIGGKKVMK